MARPSVEAERREQILRAACEVIGHKGVNAMRVTDVAKLARISTGSVHYYFETKRDLTQAALEWNFTAVPDAQGGDPHPGCTNAHDRFAGLCRLLPAPRRRDNRGVARVGGDVGGGTARPGPT